MPLKNTSKEHTHSNVIASAYALTKSFAGKKALDNIDIEIKSGQILGILGANGAGKTTLINILLGRLNADSGDVSVFGVKAGSLQAKRQAGAMLQVANLPETLKIKEHIQLFQSYYPHPMDYQQVINYAGLQDMQNRYSKLFLDEPSVGMDVEARHGLWQAIRDLRAAGTGIVLTTHYLEEADHLADEIVLIKEGQVIRQGSSEAIKASISHTTIRFNYNEKPEAFAQLPGVVSVQPSGKFIQLHSQNVNQTLLALLSTYPNLQDLTVSRAGLEEAFLQLNGSGE
jgi:ABC-2 type transport system ATP-binding protein